MPWHVDAETGVMLNDEVDLFTEAAIPDVLQASVLGAPFKRTYCGLSFFFFN